MKIEFCPKKEPKRMTIYDLKAGDIFRFKDTGFFSDTVDVHGFYMAMNFRNDMIYVNLVTYDSNYMADICDDLHENVKILEAELKIYE